MQELKSAIGAHAARDAAAVMDRGQKSRYEFVASLRMHNGISILGDLKQTHARKAEALKAERGRGPETADEAAELLRDEPVYQFNRFLFQQVQRLTWDALAEIEPMVSDRIPESRRIPENPKGSLTLDPAFRPPAYYDAVEYHLQPGSYHNSELLHVMARYAGPGIFIPGNVKGIIDHLRPALPDWTPKRILDVGTGAGRTAICFTDAYPEAEVHGIDVAANLLTDAHVTAERAGKAIHYSLQSAEATNFPDGYFDLISMYTLQHEVPPAPMKSILHEMVRILSPGGRLINGDIAPHRTMPPLMRHLREWEVENFGEPYVRAAGSLDLASMFREAGLVNVQEVAPDNYPNGLDFPWLTFGDKPAT
jgi:2-polyprenyl-3-methyl-5-hydroxy-6-metoxy-1,4-benzoquinol methylase